MLAYYFMFSRQCLFTWRFDATMSRHDSHTIHTPLPRHYFRLFTPPTTALLPIAFDKTPLSPRFTIYHATYIMLLRHLMRYTPRHAHCHFASIEATSFISCHMKMLSMTHMPPTYDNVIIVRAMHAHIIDMLIMLLFTPLESAAITPC